MSFDPVTIEAGATVARALDRMVDGGIRHLPVVDSRGDLVGIVSIDDLAATLPFPSSPQERLAEAARGQASMEPMRVGEAMTFGPETVAPDEPIEEAARRMAARAIGCLPVVDGQGRLVGLLSETDLLRSLAGGSTERRPAQERSLASTSAGPGAPREPEEAGARLVQALRTERDDLSRELARYEEVDPEIVDRRLRRLAEALERSERGELHVCARCGGSIAAPRLRALPGTTLCSRCAREVEW